MRIATFNIENLDETPSHRRPSLAQRIEVLKPQLLRINADILCLQEIHGQEDSDNTRILSALEDLIAGSNYETFFRVSTLTSNDEFYDKRNLVILSRYEIDETTQYRNDKIDPLLYRRVTAIPPETEARQLSWERPILHAQITSPLGKLHVINVHLKSRIPSSVPGQRKGFQYNSASGWAEGYFISSMKRVGQALEARLLVDELFDLEEEANIVVCGDFNAEPGQVPVEAIVGRVENLANPDLRNRQLIAASESLSRDRRFSHIHGGQGNMLDHILFSQSMLGSYQKCEVHNENLHDESLAYAADSKYPESDHAPFIVEFGS